jgi:hypothetical protein
MAVLVLGTQSAAGRELVARISKSDVSRILRLALLAPDLVEAILGGWADQQVMLEKLERPLPMGWGEQRACVCIGFDLGCSRSQKHRPPGRLCQLSIESSLTPKQRRATMPDRLGGISSPAALVPLRCLHRQLREA